MADFKLEIKNISGADLNNDTNCHALLSGDHVVVGLIIANNATTTATLDLKVLDNSQSQTKFTLCKGMVIQPNNSVEAIHGKLVLESSDYIVVNSDTDVNLFISMLQV